jgi:hypothetical protein
LWDEQPDIMRGKQLGSADRWCGSGWCRFGEIAEMSVISSHMRQLSPGTPFAGASIWAMPPRRPFRWDGRVGDAAKQLPVRTFCLRRCRLGSGHSFCDSGYSCGGVLCGSFENGAVGVRRTDYVARFEPFGAIDAGDGLRGATDLCLSFECLLEGFVDAPGARSVATAALPHARRGRAVSLATFAGVDRLLHRLLRCPNPARLSGCAASCTWGTRRA